MWSDLTKRCKMLSKNGLFLGPFMFHLKIVFEIRGRPLIIWRGVAELKKKIDWSISEKKTERRKSKK